MCKVRNLRTLVKQRLNVAVEEIFELFERTIAEYEEELGRREEADERRQRQQLDAVLKPANEADVQRALVECQEEVPSEQQEEPADPSHLKEEEEDVWSSQDGEQLQGLEEVGYVNSLPWTGVRVKSEDDDGGVTQRVLAGCQEEQEPQPGLVKEENTLSSRDGERLQSLEEAEMIAYTLTGVHMKSEEDEGQPSQLHHRQSGEKPSQHATTEADGQHCEDLRSQPDNFAPLSDVMMMSHSSDTDHADDTREPSETNEKSKGDTTRRTDIKHSGEKPFPCSLCHKRFSSKSCMSRHMVIHTGDKAFSCSVCDKRFYDKFDMKKHMRRHTEEKPFSCSVCAKGFHFKFELKMHMSTHTGEKPFTCPVCARGLTRRSCLIQHMRTHSDEKPFTCPVCAKGLTRRSYLRQHMRTHIGEKPSTSSSSSQLMTTEADGECFNCSECGKTFARKGNLKKHMLTHSGEKPFACSVCDERFASKRCLTRHVPIHTGEKPFSCSVCAKRFYEKCDVKKHMSTHVAEKAFPCSFCGQTFREKYRMIYHMKRMSCR
ncbi:zinc finger protein 25-like isoform X2 [Phycodurus eques]|uniref:zinc finger protein 25-like isoform X2 n=1 Tax=Phycodurus eques TaxID=693459 RepID=UPI002ACD43E0|nr:zinc finger protein 25-like isoform X2 [Phycodurus eques]